MSLKKILSLLILSVLLLTQSADARIRLEVTFTHKLGVDNNMVLESELHSIEDVFESENVELRMQEGLSLDLRANFVQREKDYGPSPYIRVRGKIYDPSGSLLKKLDSNESLFEIGEKKTLTQSTEEGRKIELTVIPTVY